MTREDVINIAKGLRIDFKCESDTMVDFCNTVITLVQESCEDAISRQGVINYIRTLSCDLSYWSVTDEVVKDIETFPSVTPKGVTVTDKCRECEQEPMTGRWIEVDTNMYSCSHCSHCFTIVPEDNNIKQFKYCPNCKTKMVEPKERSRENESRTNDK